MDSSWLLDSKSSQFFQTELETRDDTSKLLRDRIIMEKDWLTNLIKCGEAFTFFVCRGVFTRRFQATEIISQDEGVRSKVNLSHHQQISK